MLHYWFTNYLKVHAKSVKDARYPNDAEMRKTHNSTEDKNNDRHTRIDNNKRKMHICYRIIQENIQNYAKPPFPSATITDLLLF